MEKKNGMEKSPKCLEWLCPSVDLPKLDKSNTLFHGCCTLARPKKGYGFDIVTLDASKPGLGSIRQEVLG